MGVAVPTTQRHSVARRGISTLHGSVMGTGMADSLRAWSKSCLKGPVKTCEDRERRVDGHRPYSRWRVMALNWVTSDLGRGRELAERLGADRLWTAVKSFPIGSRLVISTISEQATWRNTLTSL